MPDSESTTDSKPLAAFRFGYLCRVIGGDCDADCERLASLARVVRTLSDEIPVSVYMDIRDALASLVGPLTVPVEEDDDTFFRTLMGRVNSAAMLLHENRLGTLVALADSAFTEATLHRVWYDIGAALGECVRKSTHSRGRAPSLRRFQSCIARLPQTVTEKYEILGWLRDLKIAGRKQSDLKGCLSVHGELASRIRTAESIREVFEGVFDAIESELKKDPPAPESPVRVRNTSGKSSKSPFVPTSLQSRILAALEDEALKKQPLADKVCEGEGTRLYKPGGIKELRERGLVEHRSGVGYYRPDAPPSGAIPLS